MLILKLRCVVDIVLGVKIKHMRVFYILGFFVNLSRKHACNFTDYISICFNLSLKTNDVSDYD